MTRQRPPRRRSASDARVGPGSWRLGLARWPGRGPRQFHARCRPGPRRPAYPMPPRPGRGRPVQADRRRRRGARASAASSATRGRTTRTARTTVKLGCTDCHGGNAVDRRQGVRPRPAPVPRRLADLGQPGPVVHAAQPRVARVHHVREPRRPPGRPHQLRDLRLPPRRGRQQPQEHDDPRGDALGGRPLQQRGLPAQAGPLRRELQHERRPPDDRGQPAADRGGHPAPRASCRS